MLSTASRFLSAAALFLALLLTGCASMDAAQNAMSLYTGARNVTTGYHAFSSVKDLADSKPNFAGYSSVLVLADIQPSGDAADPPMVFASNLAVYTQSVARVVRAPLQVCQTMAQCSGRVLVLNFKEDAYDRNLVQRVTVGNNLRGRLLFTDSATGQILDEKRLELAENYAGLAEATTAFIGYSMLKSYPTSTDAELERVQKEYEKVPPVAPQFERVLGKAS
jgi:hypothetical protein